MVIATYLDGRDLTYDEASTSFAIGGTPVTLEQVVEYDRYAQIQWPSEQMRAWIYQLRGTCEQASQERARAEAKAAARERAAARRDARRRELGDMGAQLQYGSLNHAMVCPHCQTKGTVRTRAIKQKKGISGGKATAAVLTGGLSLLATGLSRKEAATEAHCTNCSSTWYF